MIDQPPSNQLLRAMADALTADVMPACEPAPRHVARVVANLCQLLAREMETTPPPATSDLTTDALVAQLDAQLSAGNPTDPAENQAIFAQLLASTQQRLAIAKPQYLLATDQ